MLIDTHCHLDFEQFDPDRPQVIEQAQDAGVEYLINVGANLNGSKKSVSLAGEYDCIFAAVGIHPHYAAQVSDPDIAQITALSEWEKVVAIGEVGLDYYDRKNPQGTISLLFKKKQQILLEKFIQLAFKKKLPLIFHCRNAADDLMGIIKNNRDKMTKALMHCFSQDKQCLKQCLDYGLYISFTANITYKKAQDLRDLVKYIPRERMLLETDAPFLAAQAVRGERNQPKFLKFLAQEVARIKEMDVAEIARITTENAKRFFDV